MSLYNMLHGFNPAAPACLAALQIDPQTIGRLRDAYMDGEQIVILTRTGGGNREYYQDANTRLAAHPLYISDSDDEFDSTFALFRFRFPEEKAELLKQLSALMGPPKSLRQKTMEAIAAIKGDDPEMSIRIQPLKEKLRGIIEDLNK